MPDYQLDPKFFNRSKLKPEGETGILRMMAGRGKNLTTEESKQQADLRAFETTILGVSPNQQIDDNTGGHIEDSSPPSRDESSECQEEMEEVMTPTNVGAKAREGREARDLKKTLNKSITALDKDIIMLEHRSSSKMNSDYLYQDPDESRSAMHSPHPLSVNELTEIAKLNLTSGGKYQKTFTQQ